MCCSLEQDNFCFFKATQKLQTCASGDTKTGWMAGAGFGFGIGVTGLNTNLTSIGLNWSQNGGVSGNAFGFTASASGINFDPSIGASLQYTFIKDNYESQAELCFMKDSNFKTKDEMLNDLEKKGFKPATKNKSGTHNINDFFYNEWDGKSKKAGSTYAIYGNGKLKYLSITMSPHKT